MNILLTGSSGFLGKIIKKTLDVHFISELNRNSGDYQFSLENQIPDFNTTFDLVVHAAGKAHVVPETEAEKKAFDDINVLGTSNLLKGLTKSGLPKQFVFISSVSVYGVETGKLINEEACLSAKDPYGSSKIEAEMLIEKWCIKNNVICTILRLPLLVGKDAPGNLGAMVASIKKGYYFNIGGGNAKKSMVLAEDVAKFIPIAAKTGGTYNLTDGLHPDFEKLSKSVTLALNKSDPKNMPLLIARIFGWMGDLLGSSSPISSLKIKKINSELTFDDAKARIKLGWNPRSVVEYIQNNPL